MKGYSPLVTDIARSLVINSGGTQAESGLSVLCWRRKIVLSSGLILAIANVAASEMRSPVWTMSMTNVNKSSPVQTPSAAPFFHS